MITAASGVIAQPNNATVIAVGLDGPRGLRFGPDGNLYVAESGTGGTNTTVGQCEQAHGVGPYAGGKTASIDMIRPDGTRTTVADHLPSTISPLPPVALGDSVLYFGVADVTFLDGQLYALVSGGGCSHGNPDFPASVIRVDRETGTWTQIADLSAFIQSHPSAVKEDADFEPDETFYSMVAVKHKLYVVGPNHGQVIEVGEDGQLNQLIDISASQGHIVPTAIAFHRGMFHVGNLGTFPINPGSSKVLDISRKGEIEHSTGGFTTIVGLAFRNDDLYALELSSIGNANGEPKAGTGKVVKLCRDGSIEDVVTGLTVPGGMTFGPDGDLYISDFGAAAPGTGEIIRVPVPEKSRLFDGDLTD
jgi:hypothetical protein